MKAAFPANEPARIRALCELDILDSPPEAAFDDITRLAAELCGTPVALVSLVDGKRQWFKSRIGIEVTHTSRDVAFCAHALHAPDLLEVKDATLDPRFADNPLVTGEPGIRFYAGAPLLTPDGEVLGTLCVIDWTPRSLDDRQRRALRTLADQVMTQMRLRRQLHLQARTEAALKALEERWQFALDASDEGVWDWNVLTDEVFFSDRWCTMLGHAPADIPHTLDSWSSRVHPDDLEQTLHCVREHLAGRTPFYEAVFRMRASDASDRWILGRGKVMVRDADGKPLRMVGTHTDITAQKCAQRQAERMRAQLDEAQAIASMGSWDFDLASGRLTWTQQTCRLFGIEPEAFAGTMDAFLDMVLPEDRARVACANTDVTPEAPVIENTYRIRRPDGEIRWMYERGKVLFDVEGCPERRLGMVMDITEREHAREAIAATEARFRKVFEDAATGIAITTLEGRFIATNAAYRRMLGYSEEELQARTLLSITHADDLARNRALMDEVHRGVRDSFVTEKRCIAADGRIVWVRMSVSMQRDTDGTARSIIGVAEDITQQREAEARLRQSQALLAMASRVSRMGAWTIDVPGLAMTWSDEARDLFGLQSSQMPVAAEGLKLYVPEHQPRIREVFERCMQTGVPFDVELQAAGRDGQVLWVRTIGEAVRNERGEIVRVQGAFQDISERKRADEALQESRREMLTLMSNLTGMVYRCRPDAGWTMEFVSDGAHALTGYAPSELVGIEHRRYVELIHPADRLRVQQDVSRALDERRAFELTYRIFAADGGERWVWERGQGIRDADGQVRSIEGVIFDVSQRHKDEEQLRLLEMCIARMGDIVMITGTDGIGTPDGPRIHFVNEAFERITGYTREEALGMTPRMLQGPATQPEVRSRLRDALAQWQPAREQVINYRKNGEVIWLELDIVPITDEHGFYTHWLAIERDITERKVAEQAVRDSEERFRRLTRATNDAIWDWDLRYDTLWWNDGFEKLFGYDLLTIEKTISSWTSRIHPDDLDRVTEGIHRVIDDGGEQWSDSYRFRRLDGSYAFVVDRGYVIRDPDGQPTRMLGGMTDISERKRVEDELRTVATRLSHYLSVSPGVTYALAVEGERVQPEWVSDNIEWLFGYPVEQTRTPDWWRSNVHPDDLDAAIAHTREVLRTGHVVHEYRFRGADGRWIWINDHMRVERDPDGEPMRIVGAWTDVTSRHEAENEVLRYKDHLEELVVARTAELRIAQQQAEEASRAKSAFLANMSHEIRTPMNGVLGMLEVMAHSPLTAQQADMIRTARESGQTLLGLIDDILDFSKIEAGRLEILSEPLSVIDLAEGVCDALLPLAERSGVELRVIVSPEVPECVLGDAVRLRQVLYNLVGNAIKFSAGRSAPQGQVALRVTRAEASPLRLAFTVIDNGIGMTPETLQLLFRPFNQGENSASRRYGGTGLGLTICRRLIELMGGDIQVVSAPGRGSTFVAHLPFLLPPEMPAPNYPDLRGTHCIVVDRVLNDPGFADYLLHAGARVDDVADESEAVLRARDGGLDVVVIRAVERATLPLDVGDGTKTKVRQLLITRGRRRRARIADADKVSLDYSALRRRSLLQAVAIATGRESAEVLHEQHASGVPDAPAAPTVEQARASGELILVAEDDATSRKVILQQLALLGRTAEIAQNGAEALAMWRRSRYAMLLTDLHMPEMDGYALVRAIRAEEAAAGRDAQGGRMPIIALTANALRGEHERARAVGFDNYLTKPLKLEQLRVAIEQVIVGTEPTSDQPVDLPVFDVDAMRAIIGDDDESIRELLAFYLDTTLPQWGELRQACEVGDCARAAHVAHKLKSSARSVGALELAECCGTFERAARSGRIAYLKQGVKRLDSIQARAEEAIRNHLDDTLSGRPQA